MFEVVVNLLQSIPLWTAVALLASIGLFIYLYRRRGPSWGKQKKLLSVVIAVLALYNFIFSEIHATAITNSGPTSGMVVDAVNGKPIAGARVMIVWYTVGFPQTSGPMPLVLWLVPILKCDVATNAYITDASGTYSFPWLGFKTWRGCPYVRLSVYAAGYQRILIPNAEQYARGDRVAAAFSYRVLRLVPLAESASKGQEGQR